MEIELSSRDYSNLGIVAEQWIRDIHSFLGPGEFALYFLLVFVG